jgi:hypothetical protein
MARGDLNSSQTGTGTRGSAASDKSVESSVLRVLNTKFGLSERKVQQLEELAALRGRASDGSYPSAAVRRKDLATIGQMSAMTSQQVTAAPTQADFNALQADVAEIYQALVAITQAFSS